MKSGVRLSAAIGWSGFYTLAFGAVVGSGWVIFLGEWLRGAGPGGSVVGLLIGGSVMMLIGLCYGELASRSSVAGGEFLYVYETFGPQPAFWVGWVLTAYHVSVCGFEAIALGWMLRALLPGIAVADAYSIAGAPVGWDALAIGIFTALGIGIVHCRGAAAAIRFQNGVTFSFIAVSILLICAGVSLGEVKNLRPLFVEGAGSSFTGILWAFSTAAFFLNGWQAALHAIEERRADVSTRAVIFSIVCAIGCATIFYCGIIFSSSMAVPWKTLISRELPAAAAFSALAGNDALGMLVLAAAIVSLSKTWSATVWIASRLLLAQARHGLMPPALARIHQPSGAPRNAVLVVTGLTCLEVLLGRSAISPIVDMLSVCSALCIILCLLALLRRRGKEEKPPPFTVPGGRATILCALAGASFMVGVAVLAPVLNGRGKDPIKWLLMCMWSGLGALVWYRMVRFRGTNGPQTARPD